MGCGPASPAWRTATARAKATAPQDASETPERATAESGLGLKATGLYTRRKNRAAEPSSSASAAAAPMVWLAPVSRTPEAVSDS